MQEGVLSDPLPLPLSKGEDFLVLHHRLLSFVTGEDWVSGFTAGRCEYDTIFQQNDREGKKTQTAEKHDGSRNFGMVKITSKTDVWL